ncbi:hypothetical protein [Promicromonospora sp. NPDC050262]|uniref:hypothetical protein n=1 Tax=Promicromonospora sp. NPDC050262 TaxID=3155036 RepID=UPI0034072F2C
MGESESGPHEAARDASSTQQKTPAPDEDASRAQWDDDGGFEPDIPRSTRAPDTEPARSGLFLRGVLDSALPHELGTDDEPERYLVTAVFSRQVSAEERALIEAPSVTAMLAERGYQGVSLKVADRRLEIAHTNLAMLVGGLATEIARVLREIDQQVVAERERRDDERLRWGQAEAARAARVKAEAERVRFE